jgi:small GTP-binding protein
MLKIIVFGKGEAGKSTFVRSIIPNAVNIEHKGRTVALDFGVITLEGKNIHLYGTPGQTRFNVIRDIIASYTHGSIILFDSTTHLTHDDQNAVKEVMELDIPFVSVLNKKANSNRLISIEDVERLCASSPQYKAGFEGDVRDRRVAMNIMMGLINQLS